MHEMRTLLLIMLGCGIGFLAGEFHGRSFVYERFISPEVIANAAVQERLAMVVEE